VLAPDALEKLVTDALYFRQKIPNTCLQTNLAARELQEQSGEVLPVIEEVLVNVVVPQASSVAKRTDRFMGLKNLIAAYMVLGSKHDAVRAVTFLRTLPLALQAVAVALIPLYFRKEVCPPKAKTGNDLKPRPDKQLLAFMEESEKSQATRLRECAAWASSFFPTTLGEKGDAAGDEREQS
jgi:hypothetical protein